MLSIIFILLPFLGIPHLQGEEDVAQWEKNLHGLMTEERLVLESFFRLMLAESEGGFVLEGSKPVCMEGILNPSRINLRQLGTPAHRRSVILYEGWHVWKKHFQTLPSKKLCICCKDHADSLYSNWMHLLWINPQRLVDAVEDNLNLFQYILGPELTADAFLDFLSDPSQDVPHDHTIVGIFLGFGTQNALYYRRLELIQRQLCSRENPPYVPKHERLNTHERQYLGFDSIQAFETTPSFAYSTLSEEYYDLLQKGTSSDKAPVSRVPMFAIYKRDPETLKLLTMYDKADTKIKRMLLKQNFLENVLKHIFEE